MLPTTPESAFIFSLFQFLLSGLILLVSSFLLFRREPRDWIRPLYFLWAAFFLYLGHLGLEAFRHGTELTDSSVGLPSSLLVPLSDNLETWALVCLVFVYQPHWIPRRRLGLLIVVLGAVLVPGSAQYLMSKEPPVSVGTALNLTLILTIAGLYLRRRGTRGLFTVSPLVPLFLAELTSLRFPSSGLLANVENIFQMASLVLFALFLDRRSGNLYVQVFVRLNLIFILLACGLILTVTATERRHYVSFAELNVEDLSEFLRGHVLYFWKQGQSRQQILESPEISHKIVSEFGRVPALRRVRVFLGDLLLDMAIAPDGTIDHQVREVVGEPDHSERPPGTERIMTLVKLPIIWQGQQLGRIEIDESLQAINARIADQMLTLLFAFTVMAVISGMLIALTVREANRTILRQYQELEKANHQLFHAAKLASVGQLADGIAHEINNPAGIILTRSEYLTAVLKEREDSASVLEDIEVIRRQARRIAEIVGGLLTFSRPSALQKQPVDLNALLTECLALLSPSFYARHVEVCCHLDKSLPMIRADSHRLEQVFVNILNNAVEAMPQGGRIDVYTGPRDGNSIFMRLSDTGVGVDAEDLRSVFDPFFTTKPLGRGTGLGLSVSYGIVRDHGGRIEVTSSRGQGSTFEVILPLREASDGQL